MGEFRTKQDILYADPSEIELELLEKAEAGDGLILGDGELPSEGDENRRIRAGIIRYLLLGGCEELRCHEKGVQLMGAWVPDLLDLEGCDSDNAMYISNSRFSAPPMLRGARLRGVYLDGSHCPGISADRLRLRESLHLRRGFHASGEVRLLGAEIGGDLDCEEGTFRNEGGDALDVSDSHITGGIIWRGGASAVGRVELSGASGAHLNDDWGDWPEVPGSLSLNGFTYGTIDGHGAVDAETRLKWLALDDVSRGFRPQPYQHLAKVLREMGHTEDARKVMVAKERLQRADARHRHLEQIKDILGGKMDGGHRIVASFAAIVWSWVKQWVFNLTIGFGYYPLRAVFWVLFLIGTGWWLFAQTWDAGDMTPNSAPVLVSKAWTEVEHLPHPAETWTTQARAGRDYETFSAFAYSLDVVVPLIDLGQESAWAPSTSRSDWGRAAWWARWVLKIAGWFVTALGAAAITVLVRQD